MTVKLHLFHWWAVPHLRIKAGEVGHLYSDNGDTEALHKAAEGLGLERRWIQDDPAMPHYDLWGAPLRQAKPLYLVVDDEGFYQDIVTRRKAGGGAASAGAA